VQSPSCPIPRYASSINIEINYNQVCVYIAYINAFTHSPITLSPFFLQVRSSPTSSKRSFLEQKGLTAAEIEEAFERVPNPEHNTSLPQLGTTPTHYTTGAQQPSQQQSQSIQQQPVAHWGQVALGVGFAGVSVYAIKSLLWPYVSDAINSWRRRDNNTSDSTTTTRRDTAPTITQLPSDSEDNRDDDGNDIQSSSHILASAIKSQTKELRGAIDSMKSFVERLEKGKAVDEENSGDITTTCGSAGLTIAELRQELRSFASTLNEMAKPDTSPASNDGGGKDDGRLEAELSDIKALLNEFLKSPPNAAGTLTPHHRHDDHHSTPESSRHPPPPQSIASSTLINNSHGDIGGYSPSYMEVLEMLEKGQTPPGIRSDINDKPPNPNQPPPEPKLKPKPKPWEGRASSISVGGDNDGNGNEKTGYGEAPAPSPSPTSFFTGMVPSNNNNNNNNKLSNTDPSLNKGNSSSSSKPASNIYEAATSPSQPGGVIVGRLSPDNNNYNRTLSGWEKRNNMNLGMMMMGNMGDTMEGSIGRPTSKEWKPPPMPTPSLQSGGSAGERGGDGGASSLSLGDAFSAE